jgi:hypothetical protein
VDLERLQQRLRSMTIAQLRGRWKRIDERIQDPLRSLGENLCTELEEPLKALNGQCPPLLSEFLALERPEEDAEDQDWRDWYHARQAASLAVLLEERSNQALKKALDDSALDLTKAREFIVQRQLVWDELHDRGERPPGFEEAKSEDDHDEAEGQGKSPRSSPESGKNILDRAPHHPKEKAGDFVERVGNDIKTKVSETTKNVAGTAAKASGKAFWKMATSAFKYTTQGPKKPEVPVSPRRRRRRRRGGGADSEAEETLELLEKLHELKERGILSQDEFETKKSDLLNRL